MKHSFKASNWSKMTPKLWKRIGDTAIYAQPLILGVLTQMPVSDEIIKWMIFGVSAVLIGVKTMCKFFAYPEK